MGCFCSKTYLGPKVAYIARYTSNGIPHSQIQMEKRVRFAQSLSYEIVVINQVKQIEFSDQTMYIGPGAELIDKLISLPGVRLICLETEIVETPDRSYIHFEHGGNLENLPEKTSEDGIDCLYIFSPDPGMMDYISQYGEKMDCRRSPWGTFMSLVKYDTESSNPEYKLDLRFHLLSNRKYMFDQLAAS